MTRALASIDVEYFAGDEGRLPQVSDISGDVHDGVNPILWMQVGKGATTKSMATHAPGAMR